MANYVKVGAESTYGTEATSTSGVITTGYSDTVDRGAMIEESTHTYLPSEAIGGALQASGTVDGNLRPIQMTTLIDAVMGTSAAVTDPATYTKYTLGNPKSVTLKLGEDTSEQKEIVYTGCGISSVDFNFETKDYVKTTWNWFAKDYKDENGYATPSFSSEAPVVFWRAEVSVDDNTTVGVKNLSLTIDRGLDTDQFVLGSFKRYRLARTAQTSVTGSITFTENEFDELYKALFGESTNRSVPTNDLLGKVELEITCKTPTGDTAIVFKCPTTVLTNTSRTFSGTAEVEKNVDFTVINAGTDFEIDVYPEEAYDELAITSITPTPTLLSVACAAVVVGQPTYYQWDFGDESDYSFDVAPTHVYSEAGTYTITLTIDRDDGTVAKTSTQEVTVSAS